MLLKELSEAIGVSGDEGEVRKIIINAIQNHVTDLEVDNIGNLTAFKKGTGANPLRVMIAAHMDEIGFMITGYENSGLLRFTNVGGIDDRILPALRVKVGAKKIPGVILWTPIHMNHDQNVVALKNLRIDIGVTNKGAAEGKVKRGERVAFDSNYMEISKNMLRGKAFDDRVGCSLLIDLLQGDNYPVDLLVTFTVQEEIGLRGARIAANRLKPDVAVVLEGTTAYDIPNPRQDRDDNQVPNPATRLGAGPALTVMDRSMITPPHLVNFLRQTAQTNSIPYQVKTALGGGTDGGAIHLASGGIPTAVVSVPCRYIHSPTALMNRDDYDNSLKLLQAALHALTPALLQLS